MADLRNQLAEIYVKVVADTKSAQSSMDDAVKEMKKGAKGLQDILDTNAKAQEKLSKLSEDQAKKQKERILKEFGLSKLLDDSRVKRIQDLLKRAKAAEKDAEKVTKKKAHVVEMIEQHIQNKLTKFRDYSGKLDDEELKRTQNRNASKLASYESFLKRASSEHSRYAARLDQRDLTTSTIENMRRGFEKGILISRKWHKDENTMQRIGRAIEVAGTAFHKIRGPAQMAALRFQTMQRAAYTLQAAIGVIAGSIGSLVGGLMTLVGVFGQASFALVAIGSSFASIGAGAIAARIALSGVGQAVSGLLDKQNSYNRSLRDAKRALRDLRFEVEEAALSEEEAALNLEKAREELARVQDLPPDTRARREAELQFQQAELNYRRAKARAKDAREDLKKGPMAGAGAQDPLRNLTASQKVFAKYLASLKPQMDTLKEAAASGFLPILQQSIGILVAKALPTLTIGLNTLGTAMGNAAKSFSEAFTTPENLSLLRDFFESSKPILEIFGRAAGNALGGVLGILKAAEPLTKRFANWVETTSQKLEDFGKNSSLEVWLNMAGDVAASLGKVFGTTFEGLGNIITKSFAGTSGSGAGAVMLQWLQKIADGFKAFTGNSAFAGWLQGATKNATTALSSIGALLKPITDIAAMPEIGQFWTILRGAAEPIKKLLEDGAKAGPEFAALLVSLAKLFAQFSDSGALESFFNTLKYIADTITAILVILKPVLDFIGRIHGAFLAIGIALIAFRGFMLVISGITGTVFKTIGAMSGAITKFTVQTATTVMRVQQLKQEGLKTGQAIKGVAMEFVKTYRQSAATRRSALLLQMAKDAGMTTAKLAQLEKQLNNVIMKQGVYSKSGMLAAVAGSTTKAGKSTALAKDPALQGLGKTAGARFAGGRATAGLAGGAMMLGSMGATGGSALTTGLGMAGMVASFLPGPLGLISSAVLGIGSAISSGFDAAAQAEKDRKAADAQRKIEIQAKNAQITAENLTELKGLAGALVGSGAKLGDVEGIKAKGVQDLKNLGTVTSDYDKVFGAIVQNGFAKVFAGTDEAIKTGILKEIVTTTKTKQYTSSEAAALLSPIFDEAGGGTAGLKAVQDYVKEKGFSTSKVVTPYGSTESKILPKADALAVETGAAGLKDIASKKEELFDAIELLKEDKNDRFSTWSTKDLPIFKKLTELGVDFSKLKMDRSYYKTTDVISAAVLRANEFDTQGRPYALMNAFGTKNFGPGKIPMPPYTKGYVPAAPDSTKGLSTFDKSANTTANAATTMFNAAGVLANVANTAARQPTYVIYNVTGKPGANALDIFTQTGVTPIPYSGAYTPNG